MAGKDNGICAARRAQSVRKVEIFRKVIKKIQLVFPSYVHPGKIVVKWGSRKKDMIIFNKKDVGGGGRKRMQGIGS